MKPIERCAIFGCRMPIAVCSVDRGLSRALRASDRLRLTNPASVKTSAPMPNAGTSTGAPATAASAVASVKPDARPSSA